MSTLLAPCAILLEFYVHRAEIVKELCVQRDVVEAMRTCLGECQRFNRINVLEKEARSDFPVDRIYVRPEPNPPVAGVPSSVILSALDHTYPELGIDVQQGHRALVEHVPWNAETFVLKAYLSSKVHYQ